MISVLCLDGSHTYPCIVYTCRFDVTRKAIISFKNFLPRNCEFVWEKAAYKNQHGINKSSGIISGFLKINEIISSGKIIHNSNAITNIPLNVTESLSHNHNNIIRYLLLFKKPVNINHSITDSSRCMRNDMYRSYSHIVWLIQLLIVWMFWIAYNIEK